ncbi:dTDP-4-dehydrorhamnose 3,5-epimerase [Neotamlana laminarinivorans]|uniref:dTDP-4-dehydrorhamnose 3,5-epimerase n=1 Tax=Neotamlana laminarinivorans TaxID=2883124 RepID=A0A9X1I2E8_9FLAO|nr:dTDP-4-dehydrorhamnose 3,5-epimerase [Tamlana laminarinivorans]MCB4798992.1 dTDP-4-dehydrorhamnose 3,5-epimerase [Tamlana laminarinivorans]
MIFTETTLKGAYVLDLEKRGDHRGFFSRTFCAKEFESHHLNSHFVQGNMSHNHFKHTLRGMHYQTDGAEEAKLVRCTKGALLDVILDIRPDSKSYGSYFSVELSEKNGRQLYIPKGMAHGFLTLEDDTEIAYLVSEYYTPGKEAGIRWNDPAFNINWNVEHPILSDKDLAYPDYKKPL